MQDRYAGDVGDFGKLALLRSLAKNRRLGICWYLTDGKGETSHDGRFLDYLNRPERFRDLDAPLFDALRVYVAKLCAGQSDRCIESLEQLNLLPAATVFFRILCPRLPAARAAWARDMLEAMHGAELVFLDPDNGLEGATLTPKRVALAELVALRAPGRSLLLYHHQTRRRGGAASEFEYIVESLGKIGFQTVETVRLKPYSSRFYFLLDADEDVRGDFADFELRWGKEAEHFPKTPC